MMLKKIIAVSSKQITPDIFSVSTHSQIPEIREVFLLLPDITSKGIKPFDDIEKQKSVLEDTKLSSIARDRGFKIKHLLSGLSPDVQDELIGFELTSYDQDMYKTFLENINVVKRLHKAYALLSACFYDG